MTLGEDYPRGVDHGCVLHSTVRPPAAGLGGGNAGANQDHLARGIHAMHGNEVFGDIDFALRDAQGVRLPSALIGSATPSWRSLQIATAGRTRAGKFLFVLRPQCAARFVIRQVMTRGEARC